MNLLQGVKDNIDNNKMNSVTLIKGQTKPILKKMYYPKFIDDKNIVKNNCDLTKNMIITGPNASGKTTTLKTALINIALSQNIGFGCYDKCKLEPFENIHCYLNIPDTSGRDSLFQAEARRCKEIIDCIEEKEKDNEKHFAIFDELYSGTNPDEAVISAKAFMDFIVKNDNVTCLLTTHYVKLCKKLSKNKKIENFNMKTIKKNNNFSYTYELEKGISNVKGGLKVLSDMDYPKEILEQTSEHFLQKN
jgi:DNA mismatch repair ATPase MutS